VIRGKGRAAEIDKRGKGDWDRSCDLGIKKRGGERAGKGKWGSRGGGGGKKKTGARTRGFPIGGEGKLGGGSQALMHYKAGDESEAKKVYHPVYVDAGRI